MKDLNGNLISGIIVVAVILIIASWFFALLGDKQDSLPDGITQEDFQGEQY